ncbi:hypothetical protein RI367_007331 [Sorochytrium milnesiophthora]
MAMLPEMDMFSASGFTLNIEERTALRASLVALQASQHFAEVVLWGKIHTTRVAQDYFVAVARREAASPFDVDVFFCQDMTTWVQSPSVSTEETVKASVLRTRFTGDPSFEYHLAANPDGAIPTITEAKRVTAVVQLINQEAFIVPRGAYYKSGHNTFERNAAFQGLVASDILQLASYMHFRPTKTTGEQLARANFEESIDIFDAVALDQPKGVWSLRPAPNGRSAVVLKSNMWPGFVAYHEAGSAGNGGFAKFGCLYVGSGLRSHDIGFML